MFWLGFGVGFCLCFALIAVWCWLTAASDSDDLMERALNARYPTRVDVPEIEPY